MVAEHQTITENFIPRADLVLFVFSVVNPWAPSAWELLHFVQKKWLKNVVFVLQQADLREPSEIEVIRSICAKRPSKNWVSRRRFSRSRRAKRFSRAPLAWIRSGSGRKAEFAALEQHINLMVSSSGIRILKLRIGNCSARIILDDSRRRGAWILRDDHARRRATRATSIPLEMRKEQTLRQVGGFLRDVEQACRRCPDREAGIGKKTFFLAHMAAVFRKAEWQQKFQARTRKQDARTDSTASGKRVAVARDRFAQPLAAVAGHNGSQFKGDARSAHRNRRFRISRGNGANYCNRSSSRSSKGFRPRHGRATRADVRRRQTGCASRRASRPAAAIVDADRSDEQRRGCRRHRNRGRFRCRHRNLRRVRAPAKNSRRIPPANGSETRGV